MASIADALQSVLTQGIDAAKSIKLAELQVNDPALNSVGPYGVGGRSGQGIYAGSAALAAVPPLVWYAGAALLAFVVVSRSLRR